MRANYSLIVIVLSMIFFIGITSAAVATCLEAKNGKVCQEYDSTNCAQNCNGACINSAKTGVAECNVGTCVDTEEGLCALNTHKFLCTKQSGQWSENTSVLECKEGCCVLGSETSFTTAKACSVLATRSGVNADYRGELDANDCAALTSTLEVGACVIARGTGNTCRLTTQRECSQNLAGTFFSGKLCTAPELDTDCKKTNTPIARCIDGMDELYFYDSCGNRANIYDSLRLNDATYWSDIVTKEESCSLSSGTNPVANQRTCGNCNFRAGTECGAKTATERLSDARQDSVCRSRACVDENGVAHEQGESWCAYQGAIGVQDGRSADTPGSRHWREVCFGGTVRIEPCADYRTEICVQSDSVLPSGKKFSSAACRPNTGAICYTLNGKDKPLDWKDQCTKNVDCFVKEVRVSKQFAFDLCVAKYKPAFANDESVNKTQKCAVGTQKCTYVKEEGIFGGSKEINKECISAKFAEQMNDMCMSLGDCGAQANYVGEVTQNYNLKRGARETTRGLISASYVAKLKEYADESRYKNQKPADIGSFFSSSLKFGTVGQLIMQRGSFSDIGTALSTVPFTSSVSYAASLPLRLLSIDPMQSMILDMLGLGGTKKIKVTFSCQPWQAPLGGKQCNKCGTDNFPCSKYACESLGQTCEFINEEETGVGECVDVNPNDAAAPVISANRNILPTNYRLETNDFGIVIKSSENDGCIKETDNTIPFGINVDEFARCRADYNHTLSFEDMITDLSISGNFYRNFTVPLSIPSLESLGILNPHARYDYNMYIRCQDKNGNVNTNEYVVNFCIKQGTDVNAPIIIGKDPANGFVAVDKISANISIFVNEPSECKWDTNDKAYSMMNNQMMCATDFDDKDSSRGGWPCEAALPITQNSNLFYMRCLDQPWLNGTNNSARNVATSSYLFNLSKTATPLKIDSITPTSASIVAGQEPFSVTMQVKTSGGYDGTAHCTYRYGNSSRTDFLEGSGTNIHTNVFNSIVSGSYEFDIHCEDIVGNTASGVSSFTLSIDTSAPRASRVYVQDGNLILITNEFAECYYSNNPVEACEFSYENASQMSGEELVHSTLLSEERFFIKCRDVYGNYPGACTIVADKR